MELNPNHPTTQLLHDHWHKIVAVIMVKHGFNHLVITIDDINSMPQNCFVVAHDQGDGLHIKLVDEATSRQLVAEHGGLPT